MRTRMSFTLLIALLMLMVVVSCQSREQRAISRLSDIEQSIEKYGEDYQFEDWVESYEDLDEIEDDMEYCYFTTDQKKRLEKQVQRLRLKILREGSDAYQHGRVSDLDLLGLYPAGYAFPFELELDMMEHEDEIDSIVKVIQKLPMPTDSISITK